MSNVRLSALVLALSLSLSPAMAQPGPSLFVGAGVTFPVSVFPEFYHPAASVDFGLAIPLSRQLSATINVGYNHFFFDDGAFIQRLNELTGGQFGGLDIVLEGGAYSVFSASTGLRFTVATPGRIALYLTGATGYFYETIQDLDAQVRDAENNLAGVLTATVEGGDTSYGFSLGAGMRIPVASGIRLFVEPRYVLILQDTQYLPVRIGLSFNNLFDVSRTPVPLEKNEQIQEYVTKRYELSAAYLSTFFSTGDLSGQSFRVSLARKLFSDRTGLILGAAYRRAVDTEILPALDWLRREGIAADLTFFVDALRFTTGDATHRLRVGLGPTIRYRWGEQPRALLFSGPEDRVEVEHLLIVNDYDRVHGVQFEDGIYFLFTNAYEETDWGGVLKLQYDLAFDRLIIGPSAGFWRYDGENVISYGLHIGMRL